MDLSVFLAQVMGISFAVVGVGIFWNLRRFQKIVKEFEKMPALVYLGGIMSLVMGLLVVLSHNIWQGWMAVITFLGWVMLVKGVVLLFLPEVAVSAWKKLHYDKYYVVSGGVALVLGLYLLYVSGILVA